MIPGRLRPGGLPGRARAVRLDPVRELEGRALMAALLVTSVADSGAGTLRQAIVDANTVGGGTIDFQLTGPGPFVIRPATALPTITAPVTIDGYSQPGARANTLARGDDAAILIQVGGLAIDAGGCTVRGLAIVGGLHLSGAGGDAIAGDFLGTDAAGTYAPPGTRSSLLIDDLGGDAIGGTDPADRNLISGATNGQGLLITGGSAGDVIRGNYIGVDVTGGGELLGSAVGIELLDAPGATVGGTDPGAGNVITRNGYGIQVGGPATGQVAAAAVIQGNLIGLDAAGSSRVGTQEGGVVVFAGPGTLIGGTTAAARNVISNNDVGVDVRLGATGVVIRGNYVGTDPAGARSEGNAVAGLSLGGTDLTVGGTDPGAGNVISGNYEFGIAAPLRGSGLRAGDVIQGNLIGTDATGTFALPNRYSGVIVSSQGNTVGGTAPGAGNVISGNGEAGISLESGAAGNLIQGNRIGTDAAGAGPLGNAFQGIYFQGGASGNTIGGTAVGAGNVISSNAQAGLSFDTGAAGNLVEGNRIGTDAAGAGPLGNRFQGIDFASGASGNTIGGTAAGAGNVIAYNGTGVVLAAGATGDAILSNAIYANALLGMDLGADGVTFNAPGGPHAGANHLQNYPTLLAAGAFGSGAVIKGTLNSAPDAAFTVQFFADPAADPSGYGQGRTYLGATTVTTDDAGNASFQALLPAVPAGVVAATATDAAGDTSEFSADLPVTPADRSPLAQGGTYRIDQDQPLIVAAPGVLAPDVAADGGALVADLVRGPAHGRLTFHPDGSFAYTPEAGYGGPDSFTYQADEGGVRSDVATVAITVAPTSFTVTTAADSGPGSLRQAILDADLTASPVVDAIRFAIPGVGPFVIRLATGLPTITHPAAIDGYTQAGARPNTRAQGDDAVLRVVLDGTLTGGADGLVIAAGDTTVRGLVIDHFQWGLALEGAADVAIAGNFIGTDPSGAHAEGNAEDGVVVHDSPRVAIGGASPADRNIISGNGYEGIEIPGGSSSGALIAGNYLGTDASGTAPLGNAVDGIIVFDGATDVTIGGATPAAGNVIAFNGVSGVGVGVAATDAAARDSILANSIFANRQLGIDLGLDGPSPNHPAQVPGNGPNHSQNYPVLGRVVATPAGLRVGRTLDSDPDGTFTVQFFADPAADASGYGQGAAFLGQATVTTDDAGHASFQAALPPGATPGQYLSATATGGGDTSEFALAVPVIAGRPSPVPANYDGTGRSEVGIYDPTVATFAHVAPGGHVVVTPFGFVGHGNIPLTGDYDGTGKTNVGIYDPTVATFAYISTATGRVVVTPFGFVGHANVPLSGDYDGTGRTNVGIYDPTVSTFASISTATGRVVVTPFGTPGHGDVPLSGDYDGSGRTEIGIYDPTVSTFAYLSAKTGRVVVMPFGTIGHGDIPLTGDFDGDGRSDIGIYDPTVATFAYIASKAGGVVVKPFGFVGHGNLPLAGDFDGSGATNVGIYDPTVATFAYVAAAGNVVVTPFGFLGHGNIPLAGIPRVVGLMASATPRAAAASPAAIPFPGPVARSSPRVNALLVPLPRAADAVPATVLPAPSPVPCLPELPPPTRRRPPAGRGGDASSPVVASRSRANDSGKG